MQAARKARRITVAVKSRDAWIILIAKVQLNTICFVTFTEREPGMKRPQKASRSACSCIADVMVIPAGHITRK